MQLDDRDLSWEDEYELAELEPDDGEELDFDRPMGHEDEDTFEKDFEDELDGVEADEEARDIDSLTDEELAELEPENDSTRIN